MSEPLPRGFARAPAAAKAWWEALTDDPRWDEFGPLFRYQCHQVLRLKCDLAGAQTPAQRASLAGEIRKSEEALGLWDFAERRKQYRQPKRRQPRPV